MNTSCPFLRYWSQIQIHSLETVRKLSLLEDVHLVIRINVKNFCPNISVAV